MSNAWTGFAQGLAQGAQTGLNLYSQYQGLERQKKLDEQNDAKFQAWQNDLAYKDQTRQQRATLADDVQNGVVNNERTAVGLNTMSAGSHDAQQWTPQQVAGLSRGPGGAFDPNAGPYLPAQREAMKDSEKYTRMSGLAMREGNDAAALQLGEAARTTKIREGVGEFMKEYDAAPDKFDQHISRYANAKTSSLMLGDRDKKGYRQVLIRDANSDAKPVNLSPTDMRQLAMGYAHMQVGDNDGAMAIFKSVNKDLAEAIARDNATTVQATTLNITATHYANQDDLKAQGLGIQREHLSTEKKRLALAQRPKEYTIEYEDGRRAIFVPKQLDAEGQAILPKGARFVLEDGQRGAKGPGMTKLPEPGTLFRTPTGEVVKVNSAGQYVSPEAPDDPKQLFDLVGKQRPSLLKKYADQISVAPDGKHLMVGSIARYRGAAPDAQIPMFDPNNAGDLAELERTLDTQVTGDARAAETARGLRIPGNMGPNGQVGAWRSADPVAAANDTRKGPTIPAYSFGF